MDISAFDLFSIGIGPSSSHTIGPMRAAYSFAVWMEEQGQLLQIHRILIELFGSLAFTGKGHGTDKAMSLGLEGYLPESVDPDYLETRFEEIEEKKQVSLLSKHTIGFNTQCDFLFNITDLLTEHPNAMRLSAYDKNSSLIKTRVYYSIGGGFIVDGCKQNERQGLKPFPFQFNTAKQLLDLCTEHHIAIKDVMMANECTRMPEAAVRERCLKIAHTMHDAIDRGCSRIGALPGNLKLERRAPSLLKKLRSRGTPCSYESIDSLDWLNLYAIAVCEENAAGGRIVTAPTNGAAGIIPAVLHYYVNFYPNVTDDDIVNFLLTAAAIGILYKKGASISGAEVGCQGEVGVACSMAAGALTSALGGTLGQTENAAEIAMEHMLGLTCDPVGGLVQIPCIERNAMGAVKALNAAHLALLGDGRHHVSLDAVIATMKQTGKDMLAIYKETSQGGLAVNLTIC